MKFANLGFYSRRREDLFRIHLLKHDCTRLMKPNYANFILLVKPKSTYFHQCVKPTLRTQHLDCITMDSSFVMSQVLSGSEKSMKTMKYIYLELKGGVGTCFVFSQALSSKQKSLSKFKNQSTFVYCVASKHF